jgi:hypothetical protein
MAKINKPKPKIMPKNVPIENIRFTIVM